MIDPLRRESVVTLESVLGRDSILGLVSELDRDELVATSVEDLGEGLVSMRSEFGGIRRDEVGGV
jgi:hypothetical protein